jgi:hypothetical protein
LFCSVRVALRRGGGCVRWWLCYGSEGGEGVVPYGEVLLFGLGWCCICLGVFWFRRCPGSGGGGGGGRR